MKNISILAALLLCCTAAFADTFIPSHCDGSTLKIHNASPRALTVVHLNEQFQLSDRTRGNAENIENGTVIAPGAIHTVTLSSSLFSGSGAWGSFQLVDANNATAATVGYSFQLHGHLFSQCGAYPTVIAEKGYTASSTPTNANPASIDVTIR